MDVVLNDHYRIKDQPPPFTRPDHAERLASVHLVSGGGESSQRLELFAFTNDSAHGSCQSVPKRLTGHVIRYSCLCQCNGSLLQVSLVRIKQSQS
jgi:hypothetical protein